VPPTDLIARWLRLDWHDPVILGLVAVIVVVALWRRWALVLLATLIVALGQGLDYLLRHGALSPAAAQAAVTAVYAVGAAFLVFLAIARLVSKR
jgi:hypothetical protein